MIKLDKLMPNGAICTNHRIQSGRLDIDATGAIIYSVTVNSYPTEDVQGPISWQDTYILQLAGTVPTTNAELENALVSGSDFSGGVVQ